MNFDVGSRIRELRMSKGLSTNKLSNLAGLSQSYIRNLEAGKYDNPTVDSLELICEALGIAFEDFVNYKDLSLSQLKAMKIVRTLSDEQLEGFCKLMGSKE
ncbi:helix-turn-helix transcriptional regulator [Anaerotruncus rubiinfantis]|uniref:helix-turn-helix transcriptional regulator n=1 Tax=Anaerotruncus rubiinfantis TaxID=1720200 RepID=UPI003D7AE3A6